LNWTFGLCERFNCDRRTFAQAVSLFDRFLSKQELPKNYLQLLAATCAFICMKYTDGRGELEPIVKYSEHAFTEEHMIQMEKDIAETLEWKFTVPTCISFMMQQLLLITPYMEKSCVSDSDKKELENCIFYAMNKLLVEPNFMEVTPSILASTCIWGVFEFFSLESVLEMVKSEVFVKRTKISYYYEDFLKAMIELDGKSLIVKKFKNIVTPRCRKGIPRQIEITARKFYLRT